MSKLFAIVKESAPFRVVASFNGRAKMNVHVLRLATGEAGEQLVYSAEMNPANDDARQKALASAELEALDAPERAVLVTLFMDMAIGVDEERVRAARKSETATASPLTTIDEPWPDPVDGVALYHELATFISERVVLPASALVAVVLWLFHTHVSLVADHTPYLHVNSPTKRCGKSRLLDLLRWIAYRCVKADSITRAALYRFVEAEHPTLLLDEMDALMRHDTQELRGLLDSGFERGGGAIVTEGDEYKPKFFATYCPKILSGIGRLDDTLEDRSISIPMARASKADIQKLKKIRGHRIKGECEPFRRQLLRWAADHADALKEAEPFEPEELAGRRNDVWRPLFAIADELSATLGATSRNVALEIDGDTEDETDRGVLILQDIRALFDAQRDATDGGELSSDAIVQALVLMEDRPWPEYRNNKPITTNSLARLLGRFKIKPTVFRIGKATHRGYLYTGFVDAFQRYLPLPSEQPKQPQQAQQGTAVTGVSDVPVAGEVPPEEKENEGEM